MKMRKIDFEEMEMVDVHCINCGAYHTISQYVLKLRCVCGYIICIGCADD